MPNSIDITVESSAVTVAVSSPAAAPVTVAVTAPAAPPVAVDLTTPSATTVAVAVSAPAATPFSVQVTMGGQTGPPGPGADIVTSTGGYGEEDAGKVVAFNDAGGISLWSLFLIHPDNPLRGTNIGPNILIFRTGMYAMVSLEPSESLSESITCRLPNKSGTLALLDDIPSGAILLPDSSPPPDAPRTIMVSGDLSLDGNPVDHLPLTLNAELWWGKPRWGSSDWSERIQWEPEGTARWWYGLYGSDEWWGIGDKYLPYDSGVTWSPRVDASSTGTPIFTLGPQMDSVFTGQVCLLAKGDGTYRKFIATAHGEGTSTWEEFGMSGGGGGGMTIIDITQVDYDALSPPDPAVYYNITDADWAL